MLTAGKEELPPSLVVQQVYSRSFPSKKDLNSFSSSASFPAIRPGTSANFPSVNRQPFPDGQETGLFRPFQLNNPYAFLLNESIVSIFQESANFPVFPRFATVRLGEFMCIVRQTMKSSPLSEIRELTRENFNRTYITLET